MNEGSPLLTGGPAAKADRAIDLSGAAANKLDMKKDGTAQVKIETKANQK